MDRHFNEYVVDYCTLRQYGSKFKFVLLKNFNNNKVKKDTKLIMKRGTNTEKLQNNISRSKSKIFEYAMCNEFEYFITLTIDQEKYNRENLKVYYKSFSKFLNNYNAKYHTKIKYLFIPELHKDGKSWHMHGLISGIPPEQLVNFDKIEGVPKRLKNHKYFNWGEYQEKFGFVSLGVIESTEKVSKYITKYISKGLTKTVHELNCRSFYNSLGLNKCVEIKKGTLESTSEIKYEFENDYCKIKWFDSFPDIEIKELYSSIVSDL